MNLCIIQACIRRKIFKINNSTLGNHAENIFRKNEIIKNKLENFFKQKINSIEKIHNKKTDNLILFTNKNYITVQNKRIKNLGGRGVSIDRRPLFKTFTKNENNNLLQKLCIDKNITNDEKYDLQRNIKNEYDDFLEKTFLGNVLHPQYIIFMKFENLSWTLYILSLHKLLSFFKNNMNIQVKNTCLHLNKNIYLQRKGGIKNDKKYNDIQTKFVIDEKILQFCYKI